MLKMMTIADNRHFSYQNENDLVEFIASEMQQEGFEINNEENLEVYVTVINQVLSLYIVEETFTIYCILQVVAYILIVLYRRR